MSTRRGARVSVAIAAVLLVLSTSCSNAEVHTSLTSACIPSPVDFALPIPEKPEKSIGPTPVPVPDVWELVATIDQSVDDALGYIQSLVVMGQESVWLSGTGNFVFLIEPDTQGVRRFELVSTGESNTSFVRLLLSEQNGLWAILFEDRGSFQAGTISINLYNHEEDAFENIAGADTLAGIAIIERIAAGDRIVEDEKGVLWILDAPTLIRFDPSLKVIEKVGGGLTDFRVWDVLVSQADTLFLVADEKTGDDTLSDRNYGLYTYDSERDKIAFYRIQPDIDQPFNLFLDHKERLWQDDYAYINLTNPDDYVWYRVIRSPVFISDRSFSYSWPKATPVLETQEKYLWFDSDSGVGVLDFETNEWCLLTTFSSRIAKDADENVWIAGDGKVYRLETQP